MTDSPQSMSNRVTLTREHQPPRIRARAGVTWRYLPQSPRSRAKHALPLRDWSVSGHDEVALCGTRLPWWAASWDWLGTGSQVESETVQRLPECRRCATLLEPAAPAPTQPGT